MRAPALRPRRATRAPRRSVCVSASGEGGESDTPSPPPPPPRPTPTDVALASGTTAAALAAAAVAVRSFAGPIAGLLPGADGAAAAALLSTPPTFTPTHAAAAAATAAAVTAARAATLAASPSYRAETDASLGGMLPALGAGSVALWLCAVPAAAEEALFRGALLPLLSPDARGVAAVAALFGVLHASGGRGVASVSFATAAGAAYGALYLAAGGDVAAPALAHALANAAAAGLWWVRQSSVTKSD